MSAAMGCSSWAELTRVPVDQVVSVCELARSRLWDLPVFEDIVSVSVPVDGSTVVVMGEVAAEQLRLDA
ncbi:MAG: hypothetical protein GC157_16960 [Frankiales bacterium]|nr:hypothetical protein [Frankiales bacterium]